MILLDKDYALEKADNQYQLGIIDEQTKISIIKFLNSLPSAQPEPHEIGHSECADAMLKMWIDKVVTDGEYYRIMDKLNIYWAKRWKNEVDS